MASQTPNIGLQLYDEGDPANLADQYNNSMDTLDGMIPGISNNAGQAIERLDALGATTTLAATEAKTKWDVAAELSATNEEDIDGIDANLNALHANTVSDATALYNRINSSTTSLRNTPMVFIGDSITQGYGADNPGSQKWSRLVCDFYHATEKNYGVGGAGFTVNGQNPNGRFDIQAQTAANDDSFDHNAVRAVFIEGGVNDNPSTSFSVASTNATACVNTLRAAFPNATIYALIGLSGALKYGAHFAGNTAIILRVPYYKKLVQALQRLGCATIDAWNLISLQINFQSTDRVHPNTAGYSYIAGQVINLLEGGKINFSDQGYTWDLMSNSSANSYFNINIGESVMNVNANLNYQFKEGDPGFGESQAANVKIISLPEFFRAGSDVGSQHIYIPSCIFANSYYFKNSCGYISLRWDEGLTWVCANVAMGSEITASTKINIIFNIELPWFGN